MSGQQRQLGPGTFDQRRRRAGDDDEAVDVTTFHEIHVPHHLSERAALASRAFRASSLASIVIAVDGEAYPWRLDADGALAIEPGDPGTMARADLDAEWFSDLVTDVRSTVALMIADRPVMTRGNITHLIAWEPVLRALVDGRPAYEPGLIDLVDATGAPLDLDRSFTLDDDPDVLRHFLAEAGFLHLRGVFDESEMAVLSAEIDAWRDRMTPDDGRAWYARVGDEQVCVRVTDLDRDAVQFPHATRLAPIAALTGAGHEYAGTDLLVKPVGVAEGISDLPTHKDCALGLHSYRCPTLTCGVAVTPATPANGQLGLLAGSHRVNIPLFDLGDGLDLPVVHPTTDVGDVTVHLSCVLHCATPPRHHERRVTYSSFRLPGSTSDLDRKNRAVRDQAGRETFAPAPT